MPGYRFDFNNSWPWGYHQNHNKTCNARFSDKNKIICIYIYMATTIIIKFILIILVSSYDTYHDCVVIIKIIKNKNLSGINIKLPQTNLCIDLLIDLIVCENIWDEI